MKSEVTHIIPMTSREVIPIQLICPNPVELPVSSLVGPHLDTQPLEDSLVLNGEGVAGDDAVLVAVTLQFDLPSLYFLHSLIKTNVAEDKAGLRPISGGDIPGRAPTHLPSSLPRTFQFAISLSVVIKQL